MTGFVFVDAPHREGWRDTGALAELSAVAGALAARGHRVTVAGFAHWNLGHRHWPASVERAAIPLIERPAIEVATGGLSNGRPAYDALCVAQWLQDNPFDVVIAPQVGGLAAYRAMATAASAGPANSKTILWASGGTCARLLADRRPALFGDLVSDALERAALRAADAIVVAQGSAAVQAGSRLALPALAIPCEGQRQQVARASFTDVTFIGALEEGSGVLFFMDALERLQSAGLLAGRSVTFVGPARDAARGLSATTLAVRARNWGFAWDLKNGLSARDAVKLMAEPQRLSVFNGTQAGFPGLLAAAAEAGAAVLAPRTRQTRALLEPETHKLCLFASGPGHLERSLTTALTSAAGPAPRLAVAGPAAVTLWADELERLGASQPSRRSPRRRSKPRMSVCVIHRDHPQLLDRALASIDAGSYDAEVEIVLVDDAAKTPAAPAIEHESPSGGRTKPLKIIRNKKPVFPAAARNQAAAAASGDCLVFLDDDNWLLEDGLARLADAMASGRYDVVTAALDMEQPGLPPDRPPLRMAFLGDAGVAGLIFNGFGDASLAISKEAFERVGGFPDEGALAPAEDWVFLARCRAAGLRMASLWQPCFGYRKPVDLAMTSWRKNHKEGALARVRQAYGRLEGEDLELALAYMQGLELVRQEDD